MLEYLDVAITATIRQFFFGFILIFFVAMFINCIGGKLRAVFVSKFGGFYDYLVLPGCMCHEVGRTLGCLATGTRVEKFEIFNLTTDDSARIPIAVSINGKFAFIKRFVILTSPVWFGLLVVGLIAVLANGLDFLPSYSASFGDGDVGILGYVTKLAIESVKMLASLFLVWHWTSPFCLLVMYLLFCIGSQIRISHKSFLLIWQSMLCIFCMLFIFNLIPGVSNGIAWIGNQIMPVVYILHATLLFVSMLNLLFYLLAKMLLGKKNY